jgi:hypothetical protein
MIRAMIRRFGLDPRIEFRAVLAELLAAGDDFLVHEGIVTTGAKRSSRAGGMNIEYPTRNDE